MGLDMYLTAEMYVSEFNERDKAVEEAIKQNVPFGLGEFRPKNITFELAYWRKANAIHGWFVKNVQEGNDDCGNYYVSPDKLKELKEDNNNLLIYCYFSNKLKEFITLFHQV